MSSSGHKVNADGFTVRSYMKNSAVAGPPATRVFQQRPYRPTAFRTCYERRELPVAVDYSRRGKNVKWMVEVEKLDYQHYLPLFFHGLCETEHPYDFLARDGIRDMLDRGGSRILPAVPKLILPIRDAMSTRNKQVMCATMRVLQHLVRSADGVGVALVPYYRQILPVFNLFRNKKRNLGDAMESPQDGVSLGDLIDETLEVLEHYGGPDAFKAIKAMVPTYSPA